MFLYFFEGYKRIIQPFVAGQKTSFISKIIIIILLIILIYF